MHTKTWTVEVLITEDEGTTRALARLHSESGAGELVGRGSARVSPDDPDVPEIGDELAASRALTDLAGQLLGVSAADISAITHERVTLAR
ncbi:DUF1876 domain-containing protein [Nocardioides ferulae]|uniref:DUF1876 domain-containing protein n=1 Tax=Nocardioides ferulae TaxID=2340821 RepID=UPI000EAE84AB|nr:DUF1876 domain-containing protein [Nocardioides ferulae]